MRSPENSKNYLNARDRFHDNRLTVVYNANAGIFKKDPIQASLFRHKLHVVNTILSSPDHLDFDVRMIPTTSINHANDVVDVAIAEGHGAVMVIGGDSTAGRAAHRIALAAETDANPKPRLIVPGGGTQNIWRSEVTHQKDIFNATLDLMVNGEETYVDMGVVKTDTVEIPFATNAGIGMDAVLLDTWEKEGKKNRLQLFRIFLRDRHDIKPLDLHIADQMQCIDEYFDNASLMPIVNHGKYGGIFPITQSNMTDGILESIVLPAHLKEPENIPHLLSTSLIRDRVFDDSLYLSLRKASIKETNGEEIIFQCDGDPHRAGSSEVNVYTLHRAVPLIVSNWERHAFAKVV